MNMDEFVKSLESQAKVGDRQLTIRPSPRSGQVFITLINLPKGIGGAGGGAEAMNNRFLATVEGFGDQSKANFGKGSGDEPPTGKVKVTTSVALWDKDGKTHKMRGKSGKPEAIAKYVAGFVSALAKIEPNYTHTKMAHMTPQTIANELRHVLSYLEGAPSRKELSGWLRRIAVHMGSALEALRALKSGESIGNVEKKQLQKKGLINSDGKITSKGEDALKLKKIASSKDAYDEIRRMIAYLRGSGGQPEIEVMADWISRTASDVCLIEKLASEDKESAKWIQKAIKDKGALHRHFGIPEDETIPTEKIKSELTKLRKVEDKSDAEKKLVHQLNMALTLRGPKVQKSSSFESC